MTILAKDLQPGDSIRVEGGLVYFHRIPVNRSQAFVAHYAKWHGNKARDGSVTYEPDEEVDVIARWPKGGAGSYWKVEL